MTVVDPQVLESSRTFPALIVDSILTKYSVGCFILFDDARLLTKIEDEQGQEEQEKTRTNKKEQEVHEHDEQELEQEEQKD